MKLKVLFLLAFAFSLNQLALAQVDGNKSKTSLSDSQRTYLIGPGDVIEGRVLGEKDFDFIATVDEDGLLQVPYSEGVSVKCLNEKGLREQVVKVYSKYIKNPQVSVFIKERNSRPQVTVYGEVVKPQQITLMRKANLLDLLAFSGGVTAKAGGMVQVTRTQPVLCAEDTDEDWKNVSNSNGINLPMRLYSLGSLRETNPTIYPGDIVFVQDAARIYVIGEVLKSGELLMPEGGLPLMQAIAMASGTTRQAKMKEIKIYRRKQNSPQPEILSVNYDAIKKGTQKDVMLEPFDIVEVGKSKKSVFDVMLDIATGSARNVANSAVMF
ncbi:MAG TPA: SLBB domain-containing protein [Pyrinomonadaceae bacterium]|jgi:protein involved in polysaccharide export with SLBB domain